MKQSNGQINPRTGLLPTIGDLFNSDVPVWYEVSGQVSSVWLSICEEERNQTTSLLESVADLRNLRRAFKQVKANGGSSGVDKQSIHAFGVWFKTHYAELQSDLLTETYSPNLVQRNRYG